MSQEMSGKTVSFSPALQYEESYLAVGQDVYYQVKINRFREFSNIKSVGVKVEYTYNNQKNVRVFTGKVLC